MEAETAPKSRKRRRPAVVCTECRRRKIACDRVIPCGHCVKSNAVCVFNNPDHQPQPRQSLTTSNTDNLDGTPAIPNRFSSAESLALRGSTGSRPRSPGRFRDALATGREDVGFPDYVVFSPCGPPNVATASTTAVSSASPGITPNSAPGRRLSPSRRSSAKADDAGFLRSNTKQLKGRYAKSRLFGQTHYLTSVNQFEELCKVSSNDMYDGSSEPYKLLRKCKQVARTLKSKISRGCNIQQSRITDLRQYIPRRDICDALVRAYLRTFESVFRILHVPSFEEEYASYWTDPSTANETFVAQLLAINSIGASVYDEAGTSPSAIHLASSEWTYAVHRWIDGPTSKRRLDLASAQVFCLLAVAIQVNGGLGDASWITTGTLLRVAMTISLHRDPDNLSPMPVLEAELRRRLWATILELVVQSSLDAGMPPFVSFDDFDTRPPANVNDDQLSAKEDSQLHPLPPHQFTQTSIQLILLQSLATRLRIAKNLNGINANMPYKEALEIHKTLTETLRSNASFIRAASPSATPFQVKTLDLLTRRFLLSLHNQFANDTETLAYHFSRKVCVDSALLLLSKPSPVSADNDKDDYARVILSAQGPFKSVTLHSCGVLAHELIVDLRADTSPTSPMYRAELYDAVHATVQTLKNRVAHGETNVKGAVFYACALAQIDALRNREDIGPAVARVALETLQECLALLEGLVALVDHRAHGDEGNGQAAMNGEATFDPSTVLDMDLDLDLEMDQDPNGNWMFPWWTVENWSA